jgi:hypothetical protein
MVLCDTDIFIEAFKNRKVATDLFRRIGFDNIALSVINLVLSSKFKGERKGIFL